MYYLSHTKTNSLFALLCLISGITLAQNLPAPAAANNPANGNPNQGNPYNFPLFGGGIPDGNFPQNYFPQGFSKVAPYAQPTSPANQLSGYPQSPAAESKPNIQGQPPQQDPKQQGPKQQKPQPQQQVPQQQVPQQQGLRQQGPQRQESEQPAAKTPANEKRGKNYNTPSTKSSSIATTTTNKSTPTGPQTAFGTTISATEVSSYKPGTPEPFLVTQWMETVSTPLSQMTQNENLFKFNPTMVGTTTLGATSVAAATEINPTAATAV